MPFTRGCAKRLRRRWVAAATGAFATALLCVGTVAASSNAPPPIRIQVPSPVEATDAAGADSTYHVKAYNTSTPIDATCDIPTGTAGPGYFDAPSTHHPPGPATLTCTAAVSGVRAHSAL